MEHFGNTNNTRDNFVRPNIPTIPTYLTNEIEDIITRHAPTIANRPNVIAMIKGGAMPGMARELDSQFGFVIKELSDVLDRVERIRTEYQRNSLNPFGTTTICISTKVMDLLKTVQCLQNDLQLAVGSNVCPPRGAPAPIGGGGDAPPLLGPHRGESDQFRLGGRGGGRWVF